MRVRQLRGIPIVDPVRARKIGTVSDFLLDGETGRLAALEVEGRESEPAERIPASRIRRVGRHGVMLAGAYDSRNDALPAASERWLGMDSLSGSGLEILGDDGERVGFLGDANFDQDTLKIESYMLRSGGWPFGSRQVRPEQVASCSRELMVVWSGKLAKQPDEAEVAATSSSSKMLVDGQVVGAIKVADTMQAGEPAGAPHTPARA